MGEGEREERESARARERERDRVIVACARAFKGDNVVRRVTAVVRHSDVM